MAFIGFLIMILVSVFIGIFMYLVTYGYFILWFQILTKKKIREFVKAIINSINTNPQNWVYDGDHNITYKSKPNRNYSDLIIWFPLVKPIYYYCCMYQPYMTIDSLTHLERYRLYQAFMPIVKRDKAIGQIFKETTDRINTILSEDKD